MTFNLTDERKAELETLIRQHAELMDTLSKTREDARIVKAKIRAMMLDAHGLALGGVVEFTRKRWVRPKGYVETTKRGVLSRIDFLDDGTIYAVYVFPINKDGTTSKRELYIGSDDIKTVPAA